MNWRHRASLRIGSPSPSWVLCFSHGSSRGQGAISISKANWYGIQHSIHRFLTTHPTPFHRVVPAHTTKLVAGHTFDGYMSHVDEYVPHGATGAVPYMTAAAAIGVTREEIDVFAERLEKTVKEFLEKERR